MFICREYLSMSFPDIAHAFGGRHHTTAMYAVQRVLGNPEIMKEATEIKRTIKGSNSWPR